MVKKYHFSGTISDNFQSSREMSSNSKMSYIIEKSPKIIGPTSKFTAKSQCVVLKYAHVNFGMVLQKIQRSLLKYYD